MSANSEKHIPAMTGIRFVAALMIFFFHYGSRFTWFSGNSISFFHQLFLGVQVFFVLSGFIICYTYFEEASISKAFFKKYFIRRFARIYPLYLVMTVLTFLIIYKNYSDTGQWGKEFLVNITLLKGFSKNLYLTGIGPTWSLTVEETFYCLAPFIFWAIKKRTGIYLQVIVCWMLGLLLTLFFSQYPFYGFFADIKFTAFVTFFGRCFEFYCGIWLAIQFRNKRFAGIGNRVQRFPVITILGGTASIAIIALLAKISNSYGMLSTETWPGIFICNLIFPVVITIFFAGLLFEKSMIVQFLSLPLLQLLGKSSYAFFIIHTGVIATGIEKYISTNVFILLLVLQFLSIVIFTTFENPVNKWIRKVYLK